MISDKPFLQIQTWKSTPSRQVYILRMTSYELHIKNDGSIIWKESFSDRTVTFEEVFNNSPRRIKKQLAFHLDFFNS